MSTHKSKPKPLIVDGNAYVYWVRELPYDEDDAIPLNVVIRAEYGTRSVCTLTGLKNREYWHDYPNWNRDSTIQITPKVVCDLIRHAHRAGWAPSDVRANMTLEISKLLRSINSSRKARDGNTTPES